MSTRLTEQFVSEGDMNVIKGLLHYLNTNVQPVGAGLDAEVMLTDSNGDRIGVVRWTEATGYGLHFLVEAPA